MRQTRDVLAAARRKCNQEIMRRYRALGTSKVYATCHTFAHEMERAGARVSEIAARLGKSNPSVTGRYLQALRSDENTYADTLAGVFAGEEA